MQWAKWEDLWSCRQGLHNMFPWIAERSGRALFRKTKVAWEIAPAAKMQRDWVGERPKPPRLWKFGPSGVLFAASPSTLARLTSISPVGFYLREPPPHLHSSAENHPTKNGTNSKKIMPFSQWPNKKRGPTLFTPFLLAGTQYQLAKTKAERRRSACSSFAQAEPAGRLGKPEKAAP